MKILELVWRWVIHVFCKGLSKELGKLGDDVGMVLEQFLW